jgi:hypothetical protein
VGEKVGGLVVAILRRLAAAFGSMARKIVGCHARARNDGGESGFIIKSFLLLFFKKQDVFFLPTGHVGVAGKTAGAGRSGYSDPPLGIARKSVSPLARTAEIWCFGLNRTEGVFCASR